MTYWEYANASPWACFILTWLLMWLIWPVIALLFFIVKLPLLAYSRHLRHKSIRLHGWPTNPMMDADGDIVHLEKQDG